MHPPPLHYLTVALTSLIPPADSARPPLHPCLELPAALLSPLSYALAEDHYLPSPVPRCLQCFFPPSSPTVVGFATVITLFDLLTCDVISGF